jgi:hypothetical protein
MGSPYCKTILPTVDCNRKRNVAVKRVVTDGRRSAQKATCTAKRPGVCTDGNADIEELLSRNDIVSHYYSVIATVVKVINHVDGAKSRIGGRRDDRVSLDERTGSTEQDNSSIRRSFDLDRLISVMNGYKPDKGGKAGRKIRFIHSCSQ